MLNVQVLVVGGRATGLRQLELDHEVVARDGEEDQWTGLPVGMTKSCTVRYGPRGTANAEADVPNILVLVVGTPDVFDHFSDNGINVTHDKLLVSWKFN